MWCCHKDKPISAGLLVLRVGIGGMMLVHGLTKLNGFSVMADKFPDPIGVGSQLSLIMAIAAEVGCSLLLIIGFATRLAAIPLAFTMIVALFIVHADDPWKAKELAAVYLLVYASLLMTGAGSFSIDHCVFGSKTTAEKKSEANA
ncbi:Putative oxidoreductase CatD [Planctomycetes bacterium K23_9]|uniref:Oxidoreductase CatD n=2 Tax=Stieleria marina TaxID=1930275 RepID=A0A517NUS1_9BACT|nr:Putative oxidoreductase CatD [Planctomycetes bacterium K23_9]